MGRLSDMGVPRTCARAAIAALASVLGLPSLVGLPGNARAASGQAAGTLRGIVTASSVAAAPEVRITQDDVVCGKTQPDPTLVVGAGGAIANAIVILTGTTGTPAAAPSVTNRQCRFVPHVQVAAAGKPLRIANDDNVLHTTHAYAEDERSLFNVAMPMPGLSVTRPLDKAKIVRLQCDTHPWMRGYVIVTNERAAVTGPDGRFQIDQVPPGAYDVRVWHERLKGAAQKITVAPGGTAEVTFAVVP